MGIRQSFVMTFQWGVCPHCAKLNDGLQRFSTSVKVVSPQSRANLSQSFLRSVKSCNVARAAAGKLLRPLSKVSVATRNEAVVGGGFVVALGLTIQCRR